MKPKTKPNSITITEYKILTSKKPSKYRSKKVEYVENGVKKKKDSIREFRRGQYLRELEREGKIFNLHEQVTFELQGRIVSPNGKKVLERAIKLIADYTYFEGKYLDEFVVEDVKSWITKKNPTYILKRKMFKKLYPEYIFREF